MQNITLFAQIIQQLPKEKIQKIIREHQCDKHAKGLDTWTQLIAMVFAHFAGCRSIREITNGLHAAMGNRQHFGMPRSPKRSTLSYENIHRDWRVFRSIYNEMLDFFRKSGAISGGQFRGVSRQVLLLDSTIITICESLFDWAHYTKQKGALKLHMLLDLECKLPVYVFMTPGRESDMRHAGYMTLPKGAVVVGDRGYQSAKLLHSWAKGGVDFVVRVKKTLGYQSVKEFDLPDGEDEHILKDEMVRLTGEETAAAYPEELRRVTIWNDKHKYQVFLLTNNTTWTAATVAELYKKRWEIELFFKTIKQQVKIKTFFGTSENAIMIQIWTALITILLTKVLQIIAKAQWALSNLIGFVRLNLFVKISLFYWLDNPYCPEEPPPEPVQLSFNF